MIKAIETRYSGRLFRSRLEARWAVFFDALGLEWRYEPEGYELEDGTRYLPDFFLPSLNALVEIKPKPLDFDGQPWPADGTKEYRFYEALCKGSEFPHKFFMLFGEPGPAEPYEINSSYAGCAIGDSPYFFCECPGCGSIGIQFDGRSARNNHKNNCDEQGDKAYNINSPKILNAAAKATSARFEFGQTPR